MLVLFPPLALLHVKGDGKNLFVFWKQEDLLGQMQLLFIFDSWKATNRDQYSPSPLILLHYQTQMWWEQKWSLK